MNTLNEFSKPDRASDDDRWARVLERTRSRRGGLGDAFKAGFPAGEKYGASAVPERDVNEIVHDTMEMFLLLLAEEPLPPLLESLPERLGARRARQGVDDTLLLEGVRSNFTVLWHALREEAAREAPELLVDKVEMILGLVERHVSRVQRAYWQESVRLNRANKRAAVRAIAVFLASSGTAVPELAAAAAALGTTPDGLVWVAVSRAPGLQLDDRYPGWVHIVPWRDVSVLVEAARSPTPPDPPPFPSVRVPRPVPLALLPSLVRGMATLRSVTSDLGERYGLSEAILASVHHDLIERFERPETLVGSDLFEIREGERGRLLETASAYLESGSVTATAAALFCHRNTVVTRLQRLQALTGYDLQVPREALVLALALHL